ncbi:MAG TPA: C45 family peptidase [Bacteroidales bacterium]|nr:C45 family peptidase [Bacteroidales bacterium]
MLIKKKRIRRLGMILLIILLVVCGLAAAFRFATHLTPPFIADTRSLSLKVEEPDPGLYTLGNSWLKRSRSGLWEMYLEGSPFERGVINGKLSSGLIYTQEDAFVGELRKIVPSGFYRGLLKYFIYWFNRDIDQYIPEEYKEEIYGISFAASDRFSFIGSGYQRLLNYHSAHDIGHALQDLRLVGCTSFGVWSDMSRNGHLLIGRNFDFYVGDEFARNKIVCIEKPDSGHAFLMITWGGMAGAVSGMNDQGLTVTINAAKSAIPWSARTPISIVAREILQYASDIGEAMAIAKKRETFVSESILIGSARDHRAAILEKSPYRTVLVEPKGDYIICANHFQSPEFLADPLNRKDMKENASVYRYRKVLEDLTREEPLDVAGMATILRDRSGLNGADIGNGNEKAINQLIAHHSVIFDASAGKVWISTGPWQEGTYVCYDLFKIIHTFAGLRKNREITEPELTLPPDTFIKTLEFSQFMKFRELRTKVADFVRSGKPDHPGGIPIRELIRSNPQYFGTYELAGDYYGKLNRPDSAACYYRRALGKVIPRESDRERIIRKLVQSN